MEISLPNWHTLDIEYNGQGPFTAAASEDGWISVDLYNSREGFVHLVVKEWANNEIEREYQLTTIKPADRLRFTYDAPNDDRGRTIDKIEELNRVGETYEAPTDNKRLGFDVRFRDPYFPWPFYFLGFIMICDSVKQKTGRHLCLYLDCSRGKGRNAF